MKISEQWLREYLDTDAATQTIADTLTQTGIEVESVTPVAEKFSGVVVGRLISFEKHPDADRLNVCQVDVGQGEPLTIVCGATNLRADMKVPAALVGAVLPQNFKITKSKLRGVFSHGMLCSARELTLADDADGILDLPQDAPIGADVWDYFQLSDCMLDLSITPNRGDCLSVYGVARELSATLASSQLKILSIAAIQQTVSDVLPVAIDAPLACPHYLGRIIKQIRTNVATPPWMQERLKRSGLKSIHPVVDIMNYVMLEIGQPLHAFDRATLSGGIHVRMAQPGETITLLNDRTIKLNAQTLIIADDKQPLAIAGVMGGASSSVTPETQDIFIESAYFLPSVSALSRQDFHLTSDSAYRFERGVDFTLPPKAIERATQLVLEIVGGEAGPLINKTASLPAEKTRFLRLNRVHRLLGFELSIETIESILERLSFSYQKKTDGWQVTIPSYRTDIAIEEDLIEEVVRLYGYNNVPAILPGAALRCSSASSLTNLQETLVSLGYQEAITYSFVSDALQALFDAQYTPKALVNPITSDMNVMRTSLWPGLIGALQYNQNRQQSRVRLFETGVRFIPEHDSKGDTIREETVFSGLINGAALPEQWGSATRHADYFDLKGDVEHLLQMIGLPSSFDYRATSHPALHPGQSAAIYQGETCLGLMGMLHPSIAQKLDLIGPVLLFECLIAPFLVPRVRILTEQSPFPAIRRDIAIIVNQTVPQQTIQDTIKGVGVAWLTEANVFDVYCGQGIPPHQKSVALSLTLQHPSRTLLDEEVTGIIAQVVSALEERCSASLRR